MLRFVIFTLMGLLIGLSSSAYANGDSATAAAAMSSNAYIVEPHPNTTHTPKKKAKHHAHAMVYYQPPSATLYPGSLKYNIVRIAQSFGWNTVVWNVPDDYNWVGTTTITATSFAGILRKLLLNYPLQAQFYQGNHVLVIVPRNLP